MIQHKGLGHSSFSIVLLLNEADNERQMLIQLLSLSKFH